MTEVKASADAPRTMACVFPGVHASVHLRAERVGRYWEATARMRDVAAERGASSGIYEFDADGAWMPMGHYGSIQMCENAFALLVSGTHLVHKGYDAGCITWAAGIMPRAQALELMAEWCVPGEAEEHDPPSPFGP
jgi:hypothetical protein